MTSTTTDPSQDEVDLTTPATRRGWRVVDIVIAAVLGVAVGLIFFGWNSAGGALFGQLDALTPGLGGLMVGPWLLGGVLGGLIIRKPGAAILVELIAALLSSALGNQWGWTTVVSGLFQGLGAELIFLAFGYRVFRLPVAMLAGAAAGAGAWLNEFLIFGNRAKSALFNMIYLGCLLVSGAVLAGLVGWVLTRALAATGVLKRFAVGRSGTRV